MAMKKKIVAAVMLLSMSAAWATTTQKWTAGWDNFGEPLNYSKSKVKWSVNSTTKKLSVTYSLVGAVPGKLYEVGVAIFCTTFPQTFGQFPVYASNCPSITRQGVTTNAAYLEVGVITTDRFGNGSFPIVIGPAPSGTYDVEFFAQDGAGCNLIGGGSDCNVDFQSPGPFGTATTITIP
jgi:hypothetical protein